MYASSGHGYGSMSGHAYGMGNGLGSSVGYGASSGRYAASTSTHGHAGGGVDVARKASRARRESFKPRPSVDAATDLGSTGGSKWGGFAVSVKEEEEY
jgi:Ase1/PRC1/MAP65 family protein